MVVCLPGSWTTSKCAIFHVNSEDLGSLESHIERQRSEDKAIRNHTTVTHWRPLNEVKLKGDIYNHNNHAIKQKKRVKTPDMTFLYSFADA